MMNSMERLHEMTMNREMAARADAVDEAARTAELTFSSETPYERWFGPEILDHSAGAVDLSRLEDIGVVLFNHNADRPIGRVERVWIGDDARGHAQIRFDTDDESERIFRKVKNGFRWSSRSGSRWRSASYLSRQTPASAWDVP